MLVILQIYQNCALRPLIVIGAWGETRTLTWLPIPEFESGASTNFATQAENREQEIWIIAHLTYESTIDPANNQLILKFIH